MGSYKLDRTAFKAHTAKEASEYHAEYYKKLTWQERLRIANYLNSVAYNYPEDSPPRMDKTVFKVRARERLAGDDTCKGSGDLENLTN